MPRGDKTGPSGEGPLTGRRMGYCTGNNFPGCQTNQYCRGMGQGRGIGRGRGIGQGRRMLWTTPEEMINRNKEPSKEELLNELNTRKAQIEKAIKELEQKEE